MRFWYEEKIDNRIKENLFKKVLKECNEIQLVYLENRDKTETAKKIMKLLNPFVIEQKKVTCWMGTEIINEPDEDYRSVLLIRLKMVKEVFTILNEYPNLFGDDSEFEIAFFKDDQCYFYDTIHEMTFAFNLDVMLEFLKEKYHNNNPKTKNDIIFDFYNIKDGGFKQYNYNQYSWIEQDSIDKNIISKLFEYIKKKM